MAPGAVRVLSHRQARASLITFSYYVWGCRHHARNCPNRASSHNKRSSRDINQVLFKAALNILTHSLTHYASKPNAHPLVIVHMWGTSLQHCVSRACPSEHYQHIFIKASFIIIIIIYKHPLPSVSVSLHIKQWCFHGEMRNSVTVYFVTVNSIPALMPHFQKNNVGHFFLPDPHHRVCS